MNRMPIVSRPAGRPRHRVTWVHIRSYLASVAVVAITTLVLFQFRSDLDLLSVTLLFLIVVTAISLRAGTRPSIVSSLVAFLCIDFFFVPPFYTFTVQRSDHVLTLLVFLGTSVLVTQMVVRVRMQTAAALRRGRQTAILYDLSTALISQVGLDDTLATIVKRVREIFALDTSAILLLSNHELVARSVEGTPLDFANPTLGTRARAALDQRELTRTGRVGTAWHDEDFGVGSLDRVAGRGINGQEILLVPIVTHRQPLGVLLLARRMGHSPFDPDERQLLETFANQAAIAIERSLLTEERTRVEVHQRSDELKTALLSAVSHDLRTPLASIKASVTSLLQAGVELSSSDRQDLLHAIDEEADRLNRLVANLLDLSRIEAGAIQPDLDWNDIAEAIYDAVDRERATLGNRPVEIRIAGELPPLMFDYVEIVQVLVNLLQNAARYSPSDAPITIAADLVGDELEVAVSDEGPGIPLEEKDRVFDKFYRVESPRRPIGSGVGLAICRGFVEAHHGRIWVEPNEVRGSTFRFRLPVEACQPEGSESPAAQVVS